MILGVVSYAVAPELYDQCQRIALTEPPSNGEQLYGHNVSRLGRTCCVDRSSKIIVR